MFRSLFTDPFIAVKSDVRIRCYADMSIKFAEKVYTTLPSQNLLIAPIDLLGPELKLDYVDGSKWKLKPLPVKKSVYVPVELKLIGSKGLKQLKDAPVNDNMESITDLLSFAYYQRNMLMNVLSFDLGDIMHHRVEISVVKSDVKKFGGILCYSERADFIESWGSADLKRVHLADGFVSGVGKYVPFGLRGCRYIHLLIPKGSKMEYSIRVWKRVYPYEFKPVKEMKDPIVKSILEACVKNLLAVTDGGVVDTCYRERSQWVADARMSIKAIKALTNNIEVGYFVLDQIARSYSPSLGMVGGCTPAKDAKFHLIMPTFHIAFCLSVVESECKDEFIQKVVTNSIKIWKNKYLKTGIIADIRGWNFIDWDFKNDGLIGKIDKYNPPCSVLNGWWQELCDKSSCDSGICKEEFDRRFWTGHGYSLFDGGKEPNIHGTVSVLGSSLCLDDERRSVSLKYINGEINSKRLFDCVTPYFAYFVAKILPDDLKISFIKKYYGDMVKKFGTIQERVDSNCSLAHGWSIGIAEILMRN
ncbi:MAG: hypothetical protein Hyperionvirus6_105 [Hyperionvirus sp.]|uniref:Alpha-L-rhamnosidase six-hairpin glycosidase domain-containing protein n=1 Tax=Hyperionvirus sp. TaxID=2487770 RepID=A0A3G5AAA1_9VIRU|nr:MAG: hypothetical protein Hyperionvirus6_105 [Hyperionvirus sp.]